MAGPHVRDAEDRLEAYCIRIQNNPVSIQGFAKLVQTSLNVENEFSINVLDAITPKNIPIFLNWTWPWDGEERCLRSGLIKRAYPTVDPRKRVACFYSHYKLWEMAIDKNKPILVLEHDAMFIKKLDLSILDKPYDIIGINSPRGATRKAKDFDRIVQSNKPGTVVPTPRIDDPLIPQGIAGNSSYIVKPAGAKALISKVKELGAWPTDALMCYQNIKRLGVSTTYYTQVQGLPSTTTT